MGKRSHTSRILRFSLPRRSKNQDYMNVIPYLPEFAVIIKNIIKIRNLEAKEAAKLQQVRKKEEKKIEPEINQLEDSPKRAIEPQETNIIHSEQKKYSIAKSQVKQSLRKVKEKNVRKNVVRIGKKICLGKKGKKKDQTSFTYFNSIEEYFV